MRERLQQAVLREQWERRSEIIEPRFAQLKQHDGFRRWTVWGLEGVRTQWSLLCATLNLRVLHKRWQSGKVPWLKKAKAFVGGVKSPLPSAGAGRHWYYRLCFLAPQPGPI
jgi:hypothetical protein